MFALELVPNVLAAPLAGVLVDRCEPWRLMRTVAALQALVLLPLLWVDGAGGLWIVYAVVVAESVLSTVIEPCRSTTAAALVASAADLAATNQTLGMLSSVARLVGGPLGGLLLGDERDRRRAARRRGDVRRRRRAVRAPAAATGRPRAAPAAPAGVVRDWREGLAVVARTPVLRRATLVAALAALAQGAFVVLFVLFVVRDLGASEADVGVLRGVQAVGSIAGGVLLARRSAAPTRGVSSRSRSPRSGRSRWRSGTARP